MIPEAGLVILAAAAVGLVICLCDWHAARRHHRRCVEMRVMAELQIATMLALRATPDKPGADFTKKIVPIRPESA